MARLEDRLRAHEALAARLTALSDDELIAAIAPGTSRWRASIHGSQSGVVELGDAKIFVKKISLTDLEAANPHSTANLFGLPTFYQYGVGSSGFGAWRELTACLRASDWVRAGECPYFPLVHHWRVLPRNAPELLDAQLAWLAKAPEYWNGSDAVRARLDAIASARASIVVFQEFVPHMLGTWLAEHTSGAGLDGSPEAAILRFHDHVHAAAAFMNARGMLHFDLYDSNLLTDGEQVFCADFGLAICSDFDLSPAERAFFALHSAYDRFYIDWAFTEWLAPKQNPPPLTPAVSALIERCKPVAAIFDAFITALVEESKTTPYPATELAAAASRN